MATGTPAEFPIGAIIRDLWPQKDIYRAWFEEKPVLGLMPKDEKFFEKIRYLGAGVSSGQGISSNYATAKKNTTPNENVEFQVTARYASGRVAVDGRLFRRAKASGNMSLVIDPLKDQTEGLIQTWRNDWARYIYGDGSGRLATIDATTTLASPNIIITELTELRTFDQNYPLDIVNPSTGVARAKTDDIKVIGVDEGTKKLVINGNISTLCPTAAAGDWIVREGMAGNAPLGFGAWNPVWSVASDLSTPFLGVTRSTYPNRLAGNVLFAATAGLTSPKAILMRALIMNRNNRGTANAAFMNPYRWEDLYTELQQQVVLTKTPAAPIGNIQTGVEYEGIQITGPNGKCTVYADPDCPINVARVTNISKYTYGSAGKMVDWDIGMDSTWRVENDLDERELRLFSDGNMMTDKPWETTTIVYPAYT